MKKLFSNLKFLLILYALLGVPLLWLITITLGIGTYSEVLAQNVNASAILSLLHLPFKLVLILSFWLGLPASAILLLAAGLNINKKSSKDSGNMGLWIIYTYLAAFLGSWFIAFIADPYAILGGFLSYLITAYLYFVFTRKLERKLNKMSYP
ncbi:MAG: hypothetical protein PHU64_00875 [Candidatus Omnitrophica bacterium]|nr:hypothetical protein [Candidatus Omnitrophota bacterium]MDD5430321.1 hypothetical protein [Candidatus Omnitrophota bacterium]